MENDEAAEGDRVSLMILHAAKGLEFDTVFLRGWEEGLFPNQRALHEGGVKSLEEERRLAYVGLTSARRRAIISHAANRQIYASWQSSIPSRFIVRADGAASPHYRGVGAAGAPLTNRCNLCRHSCIHQKYGYGTVKAAEQDRLDVAFDKAGAKRVLDRFVEKV